MQLSAGTPKSTKHFYKMPKWHFHSPLATLLLCWRLVESVLFWGWHGKLLLPLSLHPSLGLSSATGRKEVFGFLSNNGRNKVISPICRCTICFKGDLPKDNLCPHKKVLQIPPKLQAIQWEKKLEYIARQLHFHLTSLAPDPGFIHISNSSMIS